MKAGYYKTKESVEEYIRLAKDVNGKQLIEKLKQILPQQSVLLEIGSGPGTDWKILNAYYNVTGSDNSRQFLDHLSNDNPNGKFIELDAISLNTDLRFDGIYSNKVMHHLKDNELSESVKRQSEILNSNGIICHSFWKGESSEIFKGLFVNYHNALTLSAAYGAYFEILSIEVYTEFDDNDSVLLMARKK
ncbi:class I SAM-dependent methyltransferase [Tamlana agarivorans]|uniref:Class I SAM-dependent methyltransferase n=1 Tax=Pseudotamlana agarivorans TaxID=481183 RepID=A0ACC5U8L8_9FLAO|nr:class I SAM-dependent methyltransferase [Tamlana agarivorans]MBU2950588.1 class I SAM-dependent methyltransferase [Tamlana agarivorans]